MGGTSAPLTHCFQNEVGLRHEIKRFTALDAIAGVGKKARPLRKRQGFLMRQGVRAELTLLELEDMRAGRKPFNGWLLKLEERMRCILRETNTAARRCELLFMEEPE